METIPQEARAVLQRMEQAGYAAHLVGGCVRDLLRGAVPEDWDMTTSARPEQVMALFGAQAVPTGLRHGTVTVRQGAWNFEVTTYRVDGIYLDGRHPEQVRFTTQLSEDLQRRDFTVNAMAMDSAGHVIDLFGGCADLQQGILRCVGVPEARFQEDALRILRALRFSAVLGLELERETAEALHRSAPLLKQVAMERVQAELLKLLCGKNVVQVLLESPDVLGVVLPEILPSVRCDQRNYHHCYDVWEHIARSVGYIAPEGVLRMSMLLHDLGKPACMTVDAQGVGHFKGHAEESCRLGQEILSRLRFDHVSTARILTLVKWHDVPIEPTERAMKRALYRLGVQGVRDLLQVKRADNLAQAPEFLGRQQQIDALEQLLECVLAQNACFSLRQLAVNGNDLIALGYQGREIGAQLQNLLEAVLEGVLPNERSTLLAAAKKE